MSACQGARARLRRGARPAFVADVWFSADVLRPLSSSGRN
ncbi:hypothetical protein EKH55_1397 [Sinorhizobium alkalisoli]|nr:hypothetical protein EKH55_1397 [Sinorhizobium alkalisoli]